MASTISAGTTSGTALNIQSDTTGNLAFKTGASNVVALTIDGNQNVTYANAVTYGGNIQGAVITATTNFAGSGSALTTLNASNISSGTLSTSVLPTTGVNASTITTGTLAVAQGGTGTASPALVAGTGISISGSFPNQTITSTVTGGQLQTSLATRSAAFNSSGSPLVFNSTGNLTWTAPSGVTRVKLTVIGGGTGINNYGGYNGAGGLGVGVYTVTPGTAYSVLVGAAGAGLNGLSGVPAGGTSSFGSLLSATGGSGGSGGGSDGSAANGNLRNVSVSTWQPLGGVQPTVDGSGGRTATIDWAVGTTQGTPGATNPNNGYAISGVVFIEYVG